MPHPGTRGPSALRPVSAHGPRIPATPTSIGVRLAPHTARPAASSAADRPLQESLACGGLWGDGLWGGGLWWLVGGGLWGGTCQLKTHRDSAGVRVINVKDGDKLAAVSPIKDEGEGEAEEAIEDAAD